MRVLSLLYYISTVNSVANLAHPQTHDCQIDL